MKRAEVSMPKWPAYLLAAIAAACAVPAMTMPHPADKASDPSEARVESPPASPEERGQG